MIYSDFAIDLVVRQMAELWNKKSTPKKLSAVLLQAIEIIQQLRRKAAPQPNTPLTLAELREIAQKCEGIYVAHTDGSTVFRGQKYCAAVLDFSPAFGSTAMHVHAIYGDRLTMWEDDYGKTWTAYHCKPEEGEP